jgi:hypothetical protein
MTMTMTYFPGLLGESGVRLVGPGKLSAPAGLVRAQATSRSTAPAISGTGWTEYMANVPRFQRAAQRLLIEGQRANIVRNPRAEGAAAPATPPTNWTMTNTAGTITVTPGAGFADFNLAFSGTGSVEIRPEATAQSAGEILAGESWSLSSVVSLVSGSLTGTSSIRHLMEFRNNVAAIVGSTQSAFIPTATPVQYATSGVAPATTDRASMILRVDGVSGASLTLRVQYMQVERGAFASSPVLPALGAPAYSTRSAELVSASLASLCISGPCTILWSGTIPQNAPSGATQTLFQIDEGVGDNRYVARVESSSGAIGLHRTSAGVSAGSAVGTMVAGTPFRLGVSIDTAGRAAASLDGAAAVAITGGPTSGLTTLRIGNIVAGTAPLFGEVQQLRVLPFAFSDAQLRTTILGFG